MRNKSVELDRALAACLEDVSGGRETVDSVLKRYPEDVAKRLRPALEASLWLHQRGQAGPRPGFMAASRKRLISRIRQESESRSPALLRPALAKPWHRRAGVQLALVLLLVVALLANTNSIAAASQISFPGDAFYPVKIAREEIRLAFSFTTAGDAQLYTSFSQRRLAEMAALILDGRVEYLPQTEATFERQVDLAVDAMERLAASNPSRAASLAVQLDISVFDQVQVLSLLASAVPEQQRAAIDRAMAVSKDGKIRIEKLINY
ncbi:MAG: hypothetical protein EHM70_01570 [Chloroflexota bacterium]|nr:MAG: hypothetical protein EHM70_01570 [Chloroflexota bacterium]